MKPETTYAVQQVLFAPGDKVEWTNSQSFRRRIGVVENVRYVAQILRVVDFQTGKSYLVPFGSARLIHGYLHIDTPQQERF